LCIAKTNLCSMNLADCGAWLRLPCLSCCSIYTMLWSCVTTKAATCFWVQSNGKQDLLLLIDKAYRGLVHIGPVLAFSTAVSCHACVRACTSLKRSWVLLKLPANNKPIHCHRITQCNAHGEADIAAISSSRLCFWASYFLAHFWQLCQQGHGSIPHPCVYYRRP